MRRFAIVKRRRWERGENRAGDKGGVLMLPGRGDGTEPASVGTRGPEGRTELGRRSGSLHTMGSELSGYVTEES